MHGNPNQKGDSLIDNDALITRANKGLGYETARGLVAAGHTVYIGAQEPRPRPGRPPNGSNARFVELDVTDESVSDSPRPSGSRPTAVWTC